MITAVDTIIAVCTAPGPAALALVRLDGPAAFAIAQRMAGSGDRISAAPSHTIVYGTVKAADGTVIDTVLFLLMRGPKTFTGNDCVEITGHNNRFVVQAIIARALELGCRSARPGEYTQRAVENGKMDVLQAEALHELVVAPSLAAAQVSLRQMQGSLSHVVATVEQELYQLAAFIEASFEFSEEEHLDLDFDALVRQRIIRVQETVDRVLAGSAAAQHLREGVKIALVGSVNAGKSTLLNALIGRRRAIVSDVPGTTRDSIEAGVTVDGYAWTYIDTAGFRTTTDAIEQEGIVRSQEAAELADLVLWVRDASRGLTPDEQTLYAQVRERCGAKLVEVYTKYDALGDALPAGFAGYVVSAHTGYGMDVLKAGISARVKALYESLETPFMLNQRQSALLQDIRSELARIAQECAAPRPAYELVAMRVHGLLQLVSELSGRSVTEAVMDAVFSTFCIGK